MSDQWALSGMLQGNLHQHLRNPPTFVVNMPQGGSLKAHVRGVATLDARLQPAAASSTRFSSAPSGSSPSSVAMPWAIYTS